MAITFVAAAEAHANTATSSIVVNKPTGTTTGDFMIMAVMACRGPGSVVAFTTPSGWTLVRASAADSEHKQAVYSRVAGGSEPSTYTVAWTGDSASRWIGIASYRGASGTILAENAATESGSASPLATPSVSNTQATAWRVTIGSAIDGTSDDVSAATPSTSEVSRRAGGTAWALVTSGYYYCFQLYDSNGAIAVGSTSRSFSSTGPASFWSAAAWVGILEEGGATAVTGTASATVGPISPSLVGDVTDNATVAVQLAGVTQQFDGFGTPPAVTGTSAVQLNGVTPAFAGGVPPSGTMVMDILPQVTFLTETEVFGIRVIDVEAEESRIITVESRGVDD